MTFKHDPIREKVGYGCRTQGKLGRVRIKLVVIIIKQKEKQKKTKSNPMYSTKKAEELINDSNVT